MCFTGHPRHRLQHASLAWTPTNKQQACRGPCRTKLRRPGTPRTQATHPAQGRRRQQAALKVSPGADMARRPSGAKLRANDAGPAQPAGFPLATRTRPLSQSRPSQGCNSIEPRRICMMLCGLGCDGHTTPSYKAWRRPIGDASWHGSKQAPRLSIPSPLSCPTLHTAGALGTECLTAALVYAAPRAPKEAPFPH